MLEFSILLLNHRVLPVGLPRSRLSRSAQSFTSGIGLKQGHPAIFSCQAARAEGLPMVSPPYRTSLIEYNVEALLAVFV